MTKLNTRGKASCYLIMYILSAISHILLKNVVKRNCYIIQIL